MLAKFVSILLVFFSVQAFSFDSKSNFKGFVDIGSKELYVDYNAPEVGRPTVILLNGLTYSTVQWDAMVEHLKATGLGVLRYDMDGMGQTLLKYKMPDSPYPYQEQVSDLDDLLKTLKMKAPYNLVGLSYGGGIGAMYTAIYPRKVKNAILMAPYTEALAQQDNWIKLQVALTRLQFPFNPYSDDAIYDYFLKQVCYTTYPFAEPIVLENPYKLEAVFRMTQGIRKLKVADYVSKFPKNSVTLVMAENDQYIPEEVLENFWKIVPASAKAGKILVQNSEHKIPEAQPAKAAQIVDQIVSK